MEHIFKKADLRKFLHGLEHDVYVPTEEAGAEFFRPLMGDTTLEYFTNSDKPPKEVLFPQTQIMFDFKREGLQFTGIDEPEREDAKLLLFGARPCDVRAIACLDKLFTWDYDDTYYIDRRERTTIVSFACTNPEMPLKNCFCTSVGGSPSSTEGTDMLWTDIGDSYVVESLTDKGNAILEAGKAFFQEAGDVEKSKAEEARSRAEKAIVRRLDASGVAEALEKSFESPYWEGFAERCLGCGICTLLCPTCYCFDISDIVMHGRGRRERTWDSCQYEHYTIHASGHNPRPARKMRQRNRISHKYLYMEKRLGVVGCVGCGRCITKCPVNIDIIEVIEGIKEEASK